MADTHPDPADQAEQEAVAATRSVFERPTPYQLLADLLRTEAKTLRAVEALQTTLAGLDLPDLGKAMGDAFAALAGIIKEGQQAQMAVLQQIVALLTPPPAGPPVRATLTLRQGDAMPGKITVDSANLKVYLGFEDDKQEPTDAPDGAVVTFSVDNPNVLTVTAEPSPAADPNTGRLALVGDITVGLAGDVNVSAHATNADGSPLTEADGTTPIADPPPLALHVDPGAPASEVLTEQ